MKKTLSLIAISCALFAANAFADPIGLRVDIQCPGVVGSQDVLSNFGNYIAGYGNELIAGQSQKIYFKSNSLSKKVPPTLVGYQSVGVSYEPTSGKVSCDYGSTFDYPNFSVSYQLTNAKGGVVSQQSNDALTINLPVGFKR